jgi:hypothetical protein
MTEWGESDYRGCGQVFIALALFLLACLGGAVWLLIR